MFELKAAKFVPRGMDLFNVDATIAPPVLVINGCNANGIMGLLCLENRFCCDIRGDQLQTLSKNFWKEVKMYEYDASFYV